jgi:hypothetical protein
MPHLGGTLNGPGQTTHRRWFQRMYLSVPWRPGTPRTSSRSRQKARHAKSHALACDLPRREPHGPGQLRGRHVSSGLSSHCPARGSSETAACPAASAPAAQLGVATGPPRVLWPQLPLPGPGQLRGRHVSCGLSSRCPARGSSEAATCPAASASAARPGAAPGSPRVPWRPNGRRAI